MGRLSAAGALAGVLVLSVPSAAEAQQPFAPPKHPSAAAQQAPPGQASPPLDDTPLEAGDDEVPEPPRKLISWNEYDGRSFSFRVGGGFLYEYAAFSQDHASKQQFALVPTQKVRDLRILFSGGVRPDRAVTWSCGILYDPPTRQALFRQTGVMFPVPRLSGHIFVGRSKEGFSLNKIMVGYAGWTMERTEINDATIPILADGIKWLGYAPGKHLIWNLGFFGDWLSEGQSFSTYARQFVGRAAWLPVMSETSILHIGVSGRVGKPDDNVLQLRSRPEAFPAPFFVDTGRFSSDLTKMTELEVYYRPGPFMFGTEYFFQKSNAPESGDPVFHGGNVVATWLVTGEIRPYKTRGGFFDQVSPARPIFQGGPGAVEIVTNFSYVDLDSGTITGGKFWRLTPMANWYLSDNVRLEFTYGLGALNRFGLVGHTQFFQTRVQLTL
jgi:phosphate-selective porin OprO/OprP